MNSKVNLFKVASSHSNFQISKNAPLIHVRTEPRVWIWMEVTAVIVNLDILAVTVKQVTTLNLCYSSKPLKNRVSEMSVQSCFRFGPFVLIPK